MDHGIIWARGPAPVRHAWRPVGTLWATGCGVMRKAPPDKHGDGPRCTKCEDAVARAEGKERT